MKFEAIAPVYLSLALVLPCVSSSTQVEVQTGTRLHATGQKTAGNRPETPGGEPGKRVSFGRNIETSAGSRQTITSEASLNDYSAYRVGDRYYVVLPQASAGGDVRLRGGRAFAEMRVQRRGADVLVSYLLRPGFSARVEQRFGRLDVVFEENAGRTNATRQRQGTEAPDEAQPRNSLATKPPTVAGRNDSLPPSGELRPHESAEKPEATLSSPQSNGGSTQPQSMSPTPPPATPATTVTGDSQPNTGTTWKVLLQKREFAVPAALLIITCVLLLILSRKLKTRKRQDAGDGLAPPVTSPAEASSAVSTGAVQTDEETFVSEEPVTLMNPDGADSSPPLLQASPVPGLLRNHFNSPDATGNDSDAAVAEPSSGDHDAKFESICAAFDDESEESRSAAARALYESSKNPVESFTRALREASPERRREIGAAISASGLAAESISQLTGESRERTYEAFSLLFLMAKAGEVQPLLRAIEAHPNNEVRLAVVKLLALSGQKEVLPAFRRLAVRGSLPTEVRSAVMEAIYQISSSQPTHA